MTLTPTDVPDEPEVVEWNPAKSVSYSSMTLHRTCPQAWAYRYVRGLASPELGVARDLGSWWHLVRALDSLARGHALGSLRSVPARLRGGDDFPVHLVLDPASTLTAPRYSATREGVGWDRVAPRRELAFELAAEYWNTLGGDDKDAWLGILGESLVERLAYMDEQWSVEWLEDLRHEAPLGVEVRFNRELPGTDGARLPGVVDEVYLDTRRNLLVVRDHKTGRSLPSQESADDLSDSQLHLYAWGVVPLVSGWGQGSIRALSYDRARTAKPKTPLLTATGTLSKSVTDYDLRTYEEWSYGVLGAGVAWGEPDTFVQSGKRKGAPKFGNYTTDEKVVERLSTPAARSVWFQRTLTPVNRNVIRAHLTATLDTQRQAERTLDYHSTHHEAPRNFTRWGCRVCDYAALCRAEMMGGPDGDYPLDQFGLVATRGER